MTAPENGAERHTDKTFPWFPTYVQDWLAIPGTPEQKGVLMNLRCFAWQQNPPCSLPDDDGVLAAVSGLHDRWAVLGHTIRALYLRAHPDVAGRLLEPLLYARFNAQVALSKARQTSGKVGGERSAETRATGKQNLKQPATVASVVASILPGSLSSLESLSASKDKILNELQQQTKQEPSKPQTIVDAEQAEYYARLRDFCARWRVRYPDEFAQIEAETRRELFGDAEMTGDGVAQRMKREAVEQATHEKIRARQGLQTMDEWLTNRRRSPEVRPDDA